LGGESFPGGQERSWPGRVPGPRLQAEQSASGTIG
jgi:hypothetical protein